MPGGPHRGNKVWEAPDRELGYTETNLLLFPETSYADAGLVLEKVQRNLKEAMRANQWPVTCSINAVTFGTLLATATPDDMLNEAARAMQWLSTQARVASRGKSRIDRQFGRILWMPTFNEFASG
jgi:hypothetical protein